MKSARAWVLGLACLLPVVAGAQWQWIDKGGKRVFSDQPPPLDVPEKAILQRPGTLPRPGASGAPVASGSAVQAGVAGAPPPRAAASAAAPSGVDRELQEKTRKAEEAEKSRRAAEEQKVAAARSDNCARARQGQATLDSGMRIARLNAQGEREVLDDAGRAAEQRRLQSIIASDCN